jgi:hypothetical protein
MIATQRSDREARNELANGKQPQAEQGYRQPQAKNLGTADAGEQASSTEDGGAGPALLETCFHCSDAFWSTRPHDCPDTSVLAAAAEGGDVKQAPGEAPQSGPNEDSGNAHTPPDTKGDIR